MSQKRVTAKELLSRAIYTSDDRLTSFSALTDDQQKGVIELASDPKEHKATIAVSTTYRAIRSTKGTNPRNAWSTSSSRSSPSSSASSVSTSTSSASTVTASASTSSSSSTSSASTVTASASTSSSSSASSASETKKESLDKNDVSTTAEALSGLKVVAIDDDSVKSGEPLYLACRTKPGWVELVGSIDRELLKRLIHTESPLLAVVEFLEDHPNSLALSVTEINPIGFKLMVEIMNAFSDWEDTEEAPQLDLSGITAQDTQSMYEPFYARLAPVILSARKNSDIYDLLTVAQWASFAIAGNAVALLLRGEYERFNHTLTLKQRLDKTTSHLLDNFRNEAPQVLINAAVTITRAGEVADALPSSSSTSSSSSSVSLSSSSTSARKTYGRIIMV